MELTTPNPLPKTDERIVGKAVKVGVPALGKKPRLKLSASAQAAAASEEDTRPPLIRICPELTINHNHTGVIGSINFEEQAGSSAKFLRIANLGGEGKPKDVLDLMEQQWQVPMPCALIAIADTFDVRKTSEVPKSVRIALQRGLAEGLVKTQAWMITGGHRDSFGARIAGQAMRYAKRELGSQADPCRCVGIIGTSNLQQNSKLARNRNGDVFRYEGRASTLEESRKRALDSSHTNFFLIENDHADFRARFEKRISSFDISGDGINTPKVLLVLAGDTSTFEYIAKALDPTDPSTGVAVPVLVIKETGGVALDIYNYVLGGGCTWPERNTFEHPPDKARPLPKTDDAAYNEEARKWLPTILNYGNSTGENSTRQLSFFSFEDDHNEDLATTMQVAMLNDCPDSRQEALLAVKWGEPLILKEKLEEMGFAEQQQAQAIAAGAKTGRTARSGRRGSQLLDAEIPKLGMKELMLVVRVQARTRRYMAIKRALRLKQQRTSMMQIALERAQPAVIETLLEYHELPGKFRLDALFIDRFNRYKISGESYALSSNDAFPISELWIPPTGISRIEGSGFYQWLAQLPTGLEKEQADAATSRTQRTNRDKREVTPEGTERSGSQGGATWRDAAESKQKLTWLSNAATFHMELVFMALADSFFDHIRARWALQLCDPRFAVEASAEGFVTLRKKELMLRGDDGTSKAKKHLHLEWIDLMVWAALAGHHEVAKALWTKTRVPLRAALTVSQMCRRLAQSDELRPDRDALLSWSLQYEDLAIDLLDVIRESEVAQGLLTQVQWEWLDDEALTREPTREGGREWKFAPVFAASDAGNEVEVNGDMVTILYQKDGRRVSERCFSAHWSTPPPAGTVTGKIVSVVEEVGGAVEIADPGYPAVKLQSPLPGLKNPATKLRRVFMWPSSALDGACTEDGKLSVPCTRFVAHRHSQSVLDAYLCGDYPGSKICISPREGLLNCLLQSLLPFLPIVPTETPKNKADNLCRRTDAVDPEEEDSMTSTFKAEHDEDDADDQMMAFWQMVGGAPPNKLGANKRGAAGSPVPASIDDAGLIGRLCSAYADMRHFYFIPKVKLAMHLAAHIAYAMLFTYVAFEQAEFALWKGSVTFNEALFLTWSFARVLEEKGEFTGGDDLGESINDYLMDKWNRLDAVYLLLLIGVIILRVLTYMDASDESYFALIGSNIFSLMLVMCYTRSLQFFGYYRSVGVLIIVLQRMLEDITKWLVLAGTLSLGFAFSFAVLEPRNMAANPIGEFMGPNPVYETFWQWVTTPNLVELYEIAGDVNPTAITLPTMMWVYEFVTSILLVNLLIAMMSQTFAEVTEDGEARWLFERGKLILEYKDTKPPLPPPLNILWDLLVELPASFEKEQDEVDEDGYKLIPDKRTLESLRNSEMEHLKLCAAMQKERASQQTNARFTALEEKIAKVQNTLRMQYEMLTKQLEKGAGKA